MITEVRENRFCNKCGKTEPNAVTTGRSWSCRCYRIDFGATAVTVCEDCLRTLGGAISALQGVKELKVTEAVSLELNNPNKLYIFNLEREAFADALTPENFAKEVENISETLKSLGVARFLLQVSGDGGNNYLTVNGVYEKQ